MRARHEFARRAARRSCATLLACQLAAGSGACARTPDPTIRPDVGRVDLLVIDTAPAPAVDADQACLRGLDSQAVVYKRVPIAGGMRTPVEIAGPIGGVALVARGRRSAVMDCVLARALGQAGGVFQELGITTLAFSAAFDHRTRRGSSEASAHAYGLAIDVHVIRGAFGEYDVRQHFERAVGLWHGLRKDAGALDACVGQPTTKEGRVLRQLACRLKLHPAFRVIVTPDDDPDHQDHLHLEAGSTFFPPPVTAPPLGPPPEGPPPADATAESKPAPVRRSIAKRKQAEKRKQAAEKKTTKKKKTKTPTKKKKAPNQKSKPAPKKKKISLASVAARPAGLSRWPETCLTKTTKGGPSPSSRFSSHPMKKEFAHT